MLDLTAPGPPIITEPQSTDTSLRLMRAILMVPRSPEPEVEAVRDRRPDAVAVTSTKTLDLDSSEVQPDMRCTTNMGADSTHVSEDAADAEKGVMLCLFSML